MPPCLAQDLQNDRPQATTRRPISLRLMCRPLYFLNPFPAKMKYTLILFNKHNKQGHFFLVAE